MPCSGCRALHGFGRNQKNIKMEDMSKKITKIKQIIYVLVDFYFKLSGTFLIVKNDCIQHVNISVKNVNYITTNHLGYNKIV